MFVASKFLSCAGHGCCAFPTVHSLIRTMSSVSVQENANGLISFLMSVYKQDKLLPVQEEAQSTGSQLKTLQKMLTDGGKITLEEGDRMIQVVDELQKVLISEGGIETVIKEIEQNQLLSSFCTASKRTVDIGDYCAYYLLYPLISSLKPAASISSLAKYYMRMQSNKNILASPLAHPLLQLKQKKPKETSESNSATLTPEDCLSQLDIRVGRIVDVWNHPNSDKLLCEKVDVGEGIPRSIGSGIRTFHSAEEIKGRLKKLGGYPSNGMLLCASVLDHSKGALIDPPEGSVIGERITFSGIMGEPAAPNQVHKKKMLESVLPV